MKQADVLVCSDRIKEKFPAEFEGKEVLGRVKTVATIPAISTHQQQGDEGRRLAGILPTMIRLCVGAEHPDDVIEDLDQALSRL